MARAPVHYATTADRLEIAYQVLGDGPIDVVIVPGLTSNIDLNAQYPLYGGYVRRIPRFARTIVLDRRGAGISDREVGSGSAEDRMDDVRAVMDAVGCRRAALLGHVEGCSIAILFAATYPERASALVLVETPSRTLVAADYPAGVSAEALERMAADFRATWGAGRSIRITSDAPDEEAAVEALGVLERSHWNAQSRGSSAAVWQGPRRALGVAPHRPTDAGDAFAKHAVAGSLRPLHRRAHPRGALRRHAWLRELGLPQAGRVL